MAQDDLLRRVPDIPDKDWPFPFPRSDWDQVPPSVQVFLISLLRRIEALEAKLSENSQNSSRPPSSDSPYRKPRSKKKSGAAKDKKKRGARKGHKGARQVLLEPSKVVDVPPGACKHCGGTEILDPKPYHTLQHIEMPEPRVEVTHHHLLQGRCACCGHTVKALIDQVPAPYRVGFGPRLTAVVGFLSGGVGVGRRDVQRVIHSLFGVSVSLGAVQKMIDRTSHAIEPHYEAIREKVHSAPVNHVDETTWRCESKLHWLWVLTNRTAAYFQVHSRRSKEAFHALIGAWKGILVSDDYACYRDWANFQQKCLAHFIRRARRLAESKDTEISRFGKNLKAEFQRMCAWANAPPTAPEWTTHYMRIIKLLRAHQDRRDEAGKFARALMRQLDDLWVYLEHEGVEPTNNLAERTLRFLVIRRKVSGGTQSGKGNRWVERIASLRETCRMRGLRIYPILVDALQSLFEGRAPEMSWLVST